MKKVKVYTMSNCKSCDVIKTFLENHNIEYEELSVDTDQNAKIALIGAGITSLPFTTIGDVQISGFNQEKILEAIK